MAAGYDFKVVLKGSGSDFDLVLYRDGREYDSTPFHILESTNYYSDEVSSEIRSLPSGDSEAAYEYYRSKSRYLKENEALINASEQRTRYAEEARVAEEQAARNAKIKSWDKTIRAAEHENRYKDSSWLYNGEGEREAREEALERLKRERDKDLGGDSGGCCVM